MSPAIVRTTTCPWCGQRLEVAFTGQPDPRRDGGSVHGHTDHDCPNWQPLNAADAPQALEPGASAVTTSLPEEAAA